MRGDLHKGYIICYDDCIVARPMTHDVQNYLKEIPLTYEDDCIYGSPENLYRVVVKLSYHYWDLA